ncbi:MAG: alpha/beta fold hydrolase [Edaphobacter sp.]
MAPEHRLSRPGLKRLRPRSLQHGPIGPCSRPRCRSVATADRVAATMDALGLPQADIAAHSHGGAVAMMLAARHPHRVRRLILFAPANPYCNLGEQLIRFYQTPFGTWLARQIPWMPRRFKAVALGRMYGDRSRVTLDALEGYTEGLTIPGTVDHVLGIVRRWSADMKILRSALSGLVEKPTLLIWGDRDRAVSLDSARVLQHKLPNPACWFFPESDISPSKRCPTSVTRPCATG